MENDNIELQLLFVVMDSVTLFKAEKGDGSLKLAGVTYQCPEGSFQTVQRLSFPDIRAAVNALKDKPPVPRIETDEHRYWHRIIYDNDQKCPDSIDSQSFRALTEIVGTPIPIWTPTKGEWEELPDEYDMPSARAWEDFPVRIYRYTRRTNEQS